MGVQKRVLQGGAINCVPYRELYLLSALLVSLVFSMYGSYPSAPQPLCTLLPSSTLRVSPGDRAPHILCFHASLAPQVLKGHRDEVCALLLMPASAPGGTGGRLISGSRDAAVHVWDMRVEPAAAKTCSLGGLRWA